MSTKPALHELPDRVAAAVSGLVDDYLEDERIIAAAQARQAKTLTEGLMIALGHANLAELTCSVDRDVAVRSLTEEFATATRIHNRTMGKRISESWALTEQFPTTWEALHAGRISAQHAARIMEHGNRLENDTVRAEYEAVVVPVAEHETPSALATAARIAAERLHPTSLQERHDQAMKERSVSVRDLDDGLSELVAILPSVIAHGILNRLSKQAHHITTTITRNQKTPNRAGAGFGIDADDDDPVDSRGVDQIRADILTDLLLTANPHHVADSVGIAPTTLGEIRAEVQVTVPVLTLLGAGTGTGTDTDVHSDPGVLAGRVPIDPETARQLVGAATGWDRVLTHPISGAVLTVDRYTPGADLKRLLTARDQHCRFPGCRTRHTDLDHTTPWADGGPTTVTNLASLCRRHHVLKHESPWKVKQKPGGILEWISPTGRNYTTNPPGTVIFTPDPDPPEPGDPPEDRADAPF